MRTTPLALLLALAAAPALAAQASVTGQVLDSETQQPVAGATVALPDAGLRTVTDAAGEFALRRVPEGEQRWVIHRTGYSDWEEHSTVADGDRFTIRLLPRAVSLEAVEVTVNRLERRRRAYPGTVSVVDRDEIATSASDNLLDIVLHRAIRGGTLCGAGAICALGRSAQGTRVRVVLDDAPVLGTDGTEGLLRSYDPSEIHSVESYDGGQVVRVYTRWYVESLTGPLPPLRRGL